MEVISNASINGLKEFTTGSGILGPVKIDA
jgi:hypothetical protein